LSDRGPICYPSPPVLDGALALIGAFLLIVTQFQRISWYAVVLARLGALTEGVEQVAVRGASGIEFDDTGTGLAWERLTLRSPHDASMLLDSLSLSVSAGTRALVTGPNEAGRIALVRATAGLWRAGEGRIVRPPPDVILFLPERPCLPPGTLRHVLVRTEREQAVGDARIRDLLHALGVDDVVARASGLDAEHDWDDLLSLAEQQLLSVARITLAAPRFAVLDRPATLLGAGTVVRALDLLAARSITVVTFAPDAALAAEHDSRLDLGAGGRWSWQPIDKESESRIA
jgi:putative ATP-binding cassette transporter